MIDRRREVYQREYPRLLRALLALGRDPAAAEDAAREAFVKAHRTGLDNIQKLPAWLFVVGAREVFRKASRSKREGELWASLPARNDAFDAASDRADLLAALGEERTSTPFPRSQPSARGRSTPRKLRSHSI